MQHKIKTDKGEFLSACCGHLQDLARLLFTVPNPRLHYAIFGFTIFNLWSRPWLRGPWIQLPNVREVFQRPHSAGGATRPFPRDGGRGIPRRPNCRATSQGLHKMQDVVQRWRAGEAQMRDNPEVSKVDPAGKFPVLSCIDKRRL